MNVGSLFTGIRGLDLGLEAAGCETVWACESDEACRRIIERTAPGIPIVPDVREVDAGLPPVDVLVGGFPCPDFSVAGKRLMFEGERAQLWFEFSRAVRVLRPRHVVVENVPGLLAALGVVLADLAEAGYVGRWLCLRAADVGAPHRRERVFILATDADSHQSRSLGGGGDPSARAAQRGRMRAGSARGDRAAADADSERPERRRLERNPEGSQRSGQRQDGGQASPDAGGGGRRAGAGLRGGDPGGNGRRLADDDGREAAADAADRKPEEPQSHDGLDGERSADGWGQQFAARPGADRGTTGGPLASGPASLGGTAAGDEGDRRGLPACVAPVADADGQPGLGQPQPPGVEGARAGLADGRDSLRQLVDPATTAVEWGAYGPAVERWASILGRPAPRPTDDRGRLAPEFVEWMMGFPDGWTEGEKRTARLRMLGNAVQVQCAEVVGQLLLEEEAA